MFVKVPTHTKKLSSYRGIAPDDQLDEIFELAGRFKGARVLHLNATAFGGGVAELLATFVPLSRDVGLEAEWQVMHGAPEFFEVTKGLHNALQGMPVPLTPHAQEVYLQYSQLNADAFDAEYDFVVMHDPQVVGIRRLMLQEGRGKTGHWIWRCHIDLTQAQPAASKFLGPYIQAHDAAIFTMQKYVGADLEMGHIALIPPAIDPLNTKNRDMSAEDVAAVLHRHGVDATRPLLVQVSRYDPWKDPLGVIDVYRLVKQQVPDLQLVMVATMASDDPEGVGWFERTARHAGEDPDVFLLHSEVDNSIEVNAFQRSAQVVMQKSKREGFGLVVAEALWKQTPVVAGNVGGIPLQLRDGLDGYLVNTTEEAAERTAYLLLNPDVRSKLGVSGKEHIRSEFLVTRALLDYLRLFTTLSQ